MHGRPIKDILKKITLIVIGSAVSAFGIDLAIYAGFGGATLAVLWQGVTRVTGLTIGQASFLVAVIMIIFCWFYDRKQIYFGTIIYQIVYSACTDLLKPLVRYSPWIVLNFIIMLFGIFLFAVGTALYSFTDWGRGSYEALTFALVEKHHWQTRTVRTLLDLSVVVLGVLLGGKFGLCTVCTILLSGTMIQFTLKQLKRITAR